MTGSRRTRVLATSLIVLLVSVVGGLTLSRSSDGVDAHLTTPGEVQQPSIGTNANTTGTPFPFVALTPVDGTAPITLRASAKPMVINFWFSTCEPCKREMPALSAAFKKYGSRVNFIGINPNDTTVSAQSFLQKYGIEYANYLDNGDQLAAAGVATMPSTIFVSPDGTIATRHAGEITEKDLTEILASRFGISA